MSKKRMTRRVFAVVFALLFMITGVTIPTLTPQAATEMDLSSYITMSGKTEAAKDNGENKGIMISELILSLPADMDEKSEWEAKGIKSLSMSVSFKLHCGYNGYAGSYDDVHVKGLEMESGKLCKLDNIRNDGNEHGSLKSGLGK